MRSIQNLFPKEKFPNLMIGMDDGDDAAVYRLNDHLALVFTVDFFTPIVDDPYDFGSIAAANSMSDVYAMGGDVMLALNICGFPKDMDPAVIVQILRGGADKVIEAGGILSGGHTIDDEEPKYGLAVVGFVHPKKVTSKQGAVPGDVLILTKPLGVGIITTALKAGRARADHVSEAKSSMQLLNKKAAAILRDTHIHAMTDITGFALIGHAMDIASHSKVLLRFRLASLPFLPGAADYAEQWLFPGGTTANRQAYEQDVRISEDIPEETALLLYTPETSGGLLAAVPRNKLGLIRSRFADAGQGIWVVGEVDEGRGIEIVP